MAKKKREENDDSFILLPLVTGSITPPPFLDNKEQNTVSRARYGSRRGGSQPQENSGQEFFVFSSFYGAHTPSPSWLSLIYYSVRAPDPLKNSRNKNPFPAAVPVIAEKQLAFLIWEQGPDAWLCGGNCNAEVAILSHIYFWS